MDVKYWEKGFRDFIQVRNCDEILDACNSFDAYVGSMTTPSFKKKALNDKYYRLATPTRDESYIVYDFCPLQKLYAGVDILKVKMSKREKMILSEVYILKRSLDDVKERKPVRLPPNFSEWDEIFKYINDDDSRDQIEKKKHALRICLNERISFMERVYECGETRQSWIRPQLQIIIKLQILAAKHGI